MTIRRRALAAVVLLGLTSCAAVLPETAAAIAPATFEDLWLGILADLETWWGWAALLAGGGV